MLTLNNLVKAGKKRKRVGRGGAHGGPSGRGFGGQKARTGSDLGRVFEGGQMPITRRLPKRGFSNARFAKIYEIINLETINRAFKPNEVITYDKLIEAGLIDGKGAGVKLLGRGKLEKKLEIYVHALSQNARHEVEKLGGVVHLVGE